MSLAFWVLMIFAPNSWSQLDQKLPHTSEGLLEYTMGHAANAGPRRNPPKVKDENFVTNDKNRQAWFKFVGHPLSDGELKAMKQVIEAAKCEYRTPDLRPLLEPYRAQVEFKCNDGTIAKTECSATVSCTMGGLQFFVRALCFAEASGKCPTANECAAGSAFDIKLQNEGYTNNTFRSMWVGGQAIEK